MYAHTDKKTLFQMSALALILLPCALLFSGCGRPSEPIRKTGFYFDTVITVTLYDETKTAELEHCFALADQYEGYFDANIADSDVSKINRSGGTPVRVHAETIELIQKGLYYSRISNGKFDITIGKLTKLWDFQAQEPEVPDADEITKAISSIDYGHISVEGNEVALDDAGAAIDLGGIAKGYIADKMKTYLQGQGIQSGLIDLGGNILAIGAKTDGGAYSIGIQNPFEERGGVAASVKIKDQTVVTSGIYERYFEQDGRYYHHILDPSTGYPYENDIAGVSIICKNSVDGDGLSTVCFALGVEKGLELIESLEDTEAIFITKDMELHCSSGIGTSVPMQKL